MIQAVAPLFAIVVAAHAAAVASVATTAFAPNLIAAVPGIVLCLVVTRPIARAGLVVGGLAVVMTLLAPGLDGVHRWMPLGPLTVHASAAVWPWLCAGLFDSDRRWRRLGVVVVVVVQLVHGLQPDAAQATVLAVAVVPVLWSTDRAVGVVVGLLAAMTWWRADPLAPILHVEEIGTPIAALGLGAIVVAGLAVAVLFMPMLLAFRWAPALSSLLLRASIAAFVCAALGRFAVPVFGAGAGPVLGWYAMLSVLRLHQPTPSTRSSLSTDISNDSRLSDVQRTTFTLKPPVDNAPYKRTHNGR